jgi:hypothetical protein
MQDYLTLNSALGQTNANYHFDSIYPSEDTSKYNENWTKFVEAHDNSIEALDFKISFDLRPGDGTMPALLNNFHCRTSLVEWTDYNSQ